MENQIIDRRHPNNLGDNLGDNLGASLAESLEKVLNWAESQNYAGHSKFDVFNSPLIPPKMIPSPYVRAVLCALWARSPINLRPLLRVTKSRNPKGVALFASAYMRRHQLKQRPQDLNKAKDLLNWLEENAAPGYSGKCWGYDHPWQSLHFLAPRHSPNIVVTGNVVHAFLDAFEFTGERKYLDTAVSTMDFLIKDLSAPINNEKMRNIGYVPGSDWGVLNINGLAASVMIRTWKHAKDAALAAEARKLIAFLVDKQTDYGAWHYAWPADSSNVKHDNYHTGNVLDWILDYTICSGDESFVGNYKKGIEFYLKNLFTEEFMPKWRSDKIYPIDAHSAAQAIVTFCKAAVGFDKSYLGAAESIASWTVENMQHPQGWFYYQKGRFLTKKYTLMRWCDAWMAFALSSLLLARRKLESVPCVQ